MKKAFKSILPIVKKLIEFIIIIVAINNILMLIVGSVITYNQIRDYFPDSDEYKWVCEEIDMYIIFHESEFFKETYITIDGNMYSIYSSEKLSELFFDLDEIEGAGPTAHLILDAKKIRKDKIVFRVITDDLNLAPENGILTFVRVPIDAEE